MAKCSVFKLKRIKIRRGIKGISPLRTDNTLVRYLVYIKRRKDQHSAITKHGTKNYNTRLRNKILRKCQ